MRDVLNNIKKEVDKLADEGYTTPGEILEVLKPIRTGRTSHRQKGVAND